LRPLPGSSYEMNKEVAGLYCKYAISLGYNVHAPHLFYTNFLNDELISERDAGIALGIDMLRRCDELWVCGPTISSGMEKEIQKAHELNIPIKMISERVLHE